MPGRRAPIHHRVAKKSEVAYGDPNPPTPGVLLIGSSYREAIRINPQDAAAHFNLGLVLAGQGRAQEAEAEP